MVSVQGGELLAVVPGEGVASVAVVAPQPQLVVLALRLQAEAGIFCKDLAARPVLHGHQQFVVALVRQPVNVLQAQPVLAIDVPEPLLGKTCESVSEECAAPSASGQRGSALDRGARKPEAGSAGGGPGAGPAYLVSVSHAASRLFRERRLRAGHCGNVGPLCDLRRLVV